MLQELGVAALLFRAPQQQQPFCSGLHMVESATSESTSAHSMGEEGGSGALGEDSFRRDSSHYLDASSEDYQVRGRGGARALGRAAVHAQGKCNVLPPFARLVGKKGGSRSRSLPLRTPPTSLIAHRPPPIATNLPRAQEHPHDASPEVGCPTTSSLERRCCENIHRRPRKQSRPSACSC